MNFPFKKKKKQCSRPRWWHVCLVNIRLRTDTPNPPLPVAQVPLGEIRKLADMLRASYTSHKWEKHLYGHRWGRLGHMLCPPRPPVPHGQEKTPASPFGIKGLEPTCDTTTFKSPPEGWAPKTLAPKARRACIHKAHKTTANKETFLKGIPRNPGVMPPLPQEAALRPFFLPLPERDLFVNLKNCRHGSGL